MQVTLDIPDALASQLAAAGKDPARAALEATLVDAYRTGKLYEGDLRQALGYRTRMQVHALLAEHGVPLNYDTGDLQQDPATLDRLHERRTRAIAL